MKIKNILTLVVAALVLQTARAENDKLVVHEWGTFTSLQGGDGQLISWTPSRTADLPKFVYNWNHPGLPLHSGNPELLFGKGGVTSLQRMETPVVYFYSERERSVDLEVKFPNGTITEWFPGVNQIGPSLVDGNSVKDPLAGKAQTMESLIHWSNLTITPPQTQAAKSLPMDTNGTHYFAARETDSDLVRWTRSPESSRAESEKFLFYRGVANFKTPLRVSMPLDDNVKLANTGQETLYHLFVLDVKAKAGNFVYVSQLLPGEEKTVLLKSPIEAAGSENFAALASCSGTLKTESTVLAPAELSNNLSREVSGALISTGLYPREATAMVNTWRDSWFAEDGVRVLYVLPQTWTERTLPMTMKPAPDRLVRVMVGRAEVLAPGLEKSLALDLKKAASGDTAAAADARAKLKGLGRFAERAYGRAMTGTHFQPQEQIQLSALLNDVRANR